MGAAGALVRTSPASAAQDQVAEKADPPVPS